MKMFTWTQTDRVGGAPAAQAANELAGLHGKFQEVCKNPGKIAKTAYYLAQKMPMANQAYDRLKNGPVEKSRECGFLSVFARRAVAAAGAVVFLVTGPACSGNQTTGVPAAGGGTLTTTGRAEPRSFNRYISRDFASDVVALLTHAKLVRVNRATQELEPRLAEAWTCDKNGLTCTLKLRRNVTFSDGAPFTSADVLFAFRAIYDEKVGSPLTEYLRVDGKPLQVAAPDDHTITIAFPTPFGPGVRLLDMLPILPRHRLEARLADGTFREAWNLKTSPSEIAGLGPFVLAEYQPGQRMVFTRNTRYWRTESDNARLPYLDRIVYEIVPDQNAELLRLQARQADLTQSEIRPEDYRSLKQEADAGRLRLLDVGVGLDPDALWFNLKTKPGPGRAWLQSTALRHAISLAVDRQAFADTVFLGEAVPVGGPITPGNKVWYSPAIVPDPYDPARARTLLSQAGLVDRNRDGTLEESRQQPARFTLLTQKGNTARERGAAFIRDDLRKVGLVVDVVALEVGALVDRITKGEYEAIYFGLLATDTDPAMNQDFWLSSGGAHVWNPEQRTPATPWERRIDELMSELVKTTDQEARKRVMDEVQRVFAEQKPALYFAAPRLYVATSTRVENVTVAPLRPPVLWNAEVLRIGERR